MSETLILVAEPGGVTVEVVVVVVVVVVVEDILLLGVVLLFVAVAEDGEDSGDGIDGRREDTAALLVDLLAREGMFLLSFMVYGQKVGS